MASWLTFALYAAQLFTSFIAVNAQATNVVCASNYTWAENSLQQNPCKVASYLLATCNGGQYNISALTPGFHYLPPTPERTNPCQCSTVVYSLVAACSDCQGAPYTSWSTWSFNCSSVYLNQFPNDIPSGTAVPAWAYLDVRSVDGYNATTARDFKSPESTAPAKPTGTINTSSASLYPTTQPTSDSSNTSSNKRSNHAGAIAGGVVGGVVFLALIAGLVMFFYLRKKRAQKAPSQSYLSSEPMMAAPAPAFANQGAPSLTGSSGIYTNQTPQKLYDPSDPSTFPSSPAQSDMYTTYSGNQTFSTNTHSNAHLNPGHYAGAPEL